MNQLCVSCYTVRRCGSTEKHICLRGTDQNRGLRCGRWGSACLRAWQPPRDASLHLAPLLFKGTWKTSSPPTEPASLTKHDKTNCAQASSRRGHTSTADAYQARHFRPEGGRFRLALIMGGGKGGICTMFNALLDDSLRCRKQQLACRNAA